MRCDEARTILLDYGFDAEERRRAALVLRHLDDCDACRAALGDYDTVRDALRPATTKTTTTVTTTGAGPGDDADTAPPEPVGGWNAFVKRLEPAPAGHEMRLRPRSSGGRAAALAACIVLSVVGFQVGRTWAPGPVSPALGTSSSQPRPGSESDTRRSDDTLFASLAPSADDAARQATAFDQLSDVFDRKASWLMTSSAGASDVGLASNAVPAGQKLLMLRLTLLHAGTVASNADVVIVPGQSADLSLPMADGRSLKYHIGTSAGEPTELRLWFEVRKAAGAAGGAKGAAAGTDDEPLGALTTSLRVRPGERVAAGDLATTAGRYELKVGFAQAQRPAGMPAAPPAPTPPERREGAQ